MSRTRVALGAMSLVLASMSSALAGQPLETESSRLLPAHRLELETGFEHQHSRDGTESAVPLAIGYGLSSRLELLVEPVPFNRVRDRMAPRVQGLGDLEVTLTSRLLDEAPRRPALALAAEVKLPTASNRRIGSGRADFTAWTIGSRRLGHWDTHANLGYTIVGRPAGVAVHNVWNYALGEEWHLGSRWEVVGEVFGSTAAVPEQRGAVTGAESATTPELGGAETVGMVGARLHGAHGWTYSLGVSVDSRSAVQLHPGLAFGF